MTVTVARTGGSDGAATVKYETAGGTAKSKQDFTARTGTLSWDAGDQDSKTIEVPIKNDKLKEKAETFTVKLSKATGAALGANSATVTINDNDTPGCGAALAAPAQLQARGQSESEIRLTWLDPSTASELRIERRQPGGTFREIASLAAGVQSFTDSGLPGGATFQYRVSAVGTDGAALARFEHCRRRHRRCDGALRRRQCPLPRRRQVRSERRMASSVGRGRRAKADDAARGFQVGPLLLLPVLRPAAPGQHG